MTEDGRGSGVCGPGWYVAGGSLDALLDAATRSLWLGMIPKKIQICGPRSRKRDLGHPLLLIFSTDFLGCGRAGLGLRAGP
jgi:hypothetical protein